MSSFSLMRDHPTLKMLGLSMLLLGAHNASFYPYQSLVAIDRIGLSEPAFALVLVMASAFSVAASVLFGLLGDKTGARRRIAIFTALCSTLGVGLMIISPGPLSMVLFHGILLPVSWSLYGQIFSTTRLVLSDQPVARPGVLATMRAAMSASYLALLLLWTLAFAAGFDVMAVYITGGLVSLALSLLVILRWPKDGGAEWHDAPSGQKLRQSLGELAHPRVLNRLLCLGAITSAGALYMVLISLVFEASPVRDTGDVALYVGLVAGFEVPFMLLLPRLARYMNRSTQMVLGAAIYTSHLALLPLLTDSAALWLLPMLAGLGGAAILTLPIGYYQDLMAGKPGAASSLIALQKLASDILAAAAFTIGALLGGYELTALLGTAIALAGALGLHFADREAATLPPGGKPFGSHV